MCVRARACVRACLYVRACVRLCAYACVRACACACVRAHVRVCARVCARSRGRVGNTYMCSNDTPNNYMHARTQVRVAELSAKDDLLVLRTIAARS